MNIEFRGDIVRRAGVFLLALVTGLAIVETGFVTEATPAPAASASAAVYLEIAISGSESDRLVGAYTELAPAVEVRTWQAVNGIQTSTPLPGGLGIPAGATTVLQPGGNHLHLTGLTQDLIDGASFELILEFERAGKVAIAVSVLANAPTGGAPIISGPIAVANAWSRPVAATDSCGCSIPDSAKQWIPSATPAGS
jgi:copper(I)-binding protein